MKYPAILKLNNGCLVLATSLGCGFALQDYKDEYESIYVNKFYKDFHGFESATNKTQEYLANTYGEVRSPEHAEFIIELASNHGFDCEEFAYDKRGYFYADESYLSFASSLDVTGNDGEKQITIPLPPKAEPKIYPQDNLGKAPKHFDCVCNKCGGKCCTGQCDKQEPNEWPQVGDYVAHPTHGLCNVASPEDSIGIVTVINKNRINTLVFKSDLSKPKTPEEELREDIEYAIHQFEGDKVAGRKWLMSRYDIKKKPQ